jgi:hypothetical protein
VELIGCITDNQQRKKVGGGEKVVHNLFYVYITAQGLTGPFIFRLCSSSVWISIDHASPLPLVDVKKKKKRRLLVLVSYKKRKRKEPTNDTGPLRTLLLFSHFQFK